MHDIFISYSSENEAQVEQVRDILEQNGFTAWFAPTALRGAQDFTKEIPAAIRSAKAFLLLLSNDAQQSKWVQRELGEADACDVPIYTLFLEDCELEDQFRFVLRFNQHYPAALGFTEQMRRLVWELQSDLERERTEILLPKEPNKLKKWLWPTVAAAVIAVAAAVVLLLTGGGPKDGRYVVWNPAYSIALTDSPVSDFYLQGEAIIRNGDAPTAYTEKSVWEVTFGPDNTLTLCRNGVALGVKPGYNGIGLGGEYTATVWEWEQTEEGLYLLRNADTDYYLEWYAAKRDWNIHNKVTDNNRKQFLLRLSPVK